MLRVSGRFELSRVRVTESKITVKMYEGNRGKSILARVIGSPLYFHTLSHNIRKNNLVELEGVLNV